MKGQKPPAQIERPRRISNRIKLARNNACLVLALVGLISAALMKGPIKPVSAQTVKGSWSITGSLNQARSFHTATLLPDGKVLVAGGLAAGGALASAELYDPSTGSWSFTGSLNLPRDGHTATLLANGKVLVVGGFANGCCQHLTNTAELYNPATGEWSFTENLNVPRRGHTATLLPNGKVLVAGGGYGGAITTHTAELYDPDAGTWSLTGNLSGTRVGHAATLLEEGKVLVAGGCDDGDCNFFLGSAELYDPNTETWSLTGSLNTPRDNHTLTTLPDGNVLLPGGEVPGFSLNTVELYNPATGRWSYTGSLLNRRSLTPDTLLPSGQVLVAGGRSAELYDPATGKWNTTANLNTSRFGHTATLLPNGKVLVAGGADNTAELYDPEALDPAPRIMNASVSGKKLIVTGENFDPGAVILLNGQEQKSKNDKQNPQTRLIGKKAGKKIKPGDKLQVRNPDGTLSEEFVFAGS
ncbi:MAG TPA: kelch repeat-containing protein [Blastocatellia bacterium]|nr:kelch repeat-containing protein [Blastocatellia bacterium]